MEDDDIRAHMPLWLLKKLLERAGKIKREEGKKIVLTNYSGPFTKEQKKAFDDLINQVVED